MARLATVLSVWRNDEDAVKARLGALEHQRQELLSRIEANMRTRSEATLPNLALREQYLAFCLSSKGEEMRLRKDLMTLDQRINATREDLAKAHRRVRSIEHLQSLDAANLAKRRDKREQRQSDELAAARHLKEF